VAGAVLLCLDRSLEVASRVSPSNPVVLRRAIQANRRGGKTMAIWIQCPRKTDDSRIYLYLDNAIRLRLNDQDRFIAVS
jgi:hypothetical protein